MGQTPGARTDGHAQACSSSPSHHTIGIEVADVGRNPPHGILRLLPPGATHASTPVHDQHVVALLVVPHLLEEREPVATLLLARVVVPHGPPNGCPGNSPHHGCHHSHTPLLLWGRLLATLTVIHCVRTDGTSDETHLSRTSVVSARVNDGRGSGRTGRTADGGGNEPPSGRAGRVARWGSSTGGAACVGWLLLRVATWLLAVGTC